MKWSLAVFIWIAALSPFAVHAEPCNSHLNVFNVWDEIRKGKTVYKHTIFEMGEWDPDSQYDGVVLSKADSKNLKQAVLEVEFRSKSGKKKKFETFKDLFPFEQDAEYLQFDDFKPKEFFTFQEEGTYQVRLRSREGQEICSQKFRLGLGD